MMDDLGDSGAVVTFWGVFGKFSSIMDSLAVWEERVNP
jgi:hypothetical protein